MNSTEETFSNNMSMRCQIVRNKKKLERLIKKKQIRHGVYDSKS